MATQPSRHDKKINAAVWLAEQGCVIGWANISEGKAPKRKWKSDVTGDPALVRPLLDMGTRNSLIIPAGRVVVIDVDKAGGYERLVEAGLPDTFRVWTPTERIDPASGETYHGQHVYGLAPDEYDLTSLPGTYADGEIRALAGSMVLGPWSKRSDGVYEVIEGAPRSLALLPESVLHHVTTHRTTTSTHNGGDLNSDEWVWSDSMGSRHDHLRDRIRFWRGYDDDPNSLKRRTVRWIERHQIPLGRPGGEDIDDDEIDRMIMGALKNYPDDPPTRLNFGGAKPEQNTSRDIGTATALDLPQGSPPDLLLDPWLHPEATTVMYGPGGVGKGVTSAWLALRLVQAGHTVMILDYEYHPREWGNRLDGLQASRAEKSSIHYRAPFGPDWSAQTGALIDVWDLVRDDCDRLAITYVVVDSYTPAAGDDDRMGGQAAARQFAQAASRIARPLLVLAHVSATAGRFPDKPFGSVHIKNLVARRQWAVESIGEIPPSGPLGASTIRLEFRNTKGNDYARARPRVVSISFYPVGLIEVLDEEEPKPSSVESLIDLVLDRPLSVRGIVKAIEEDFPGDDPPSDKAVLMTLRRHPDKYKQDRSVKQRPFPWSKVVSSDEADESSKVTTPPL